ncbi:MAG: putative lipoprotein precursor [Fluviicola sp.]|jgi:hypothetical protein|uniref:hypothetical protein n=1 Tax=Fluviicola sp. TaxID=1917219 RepID=UPI00262AEEE9|nr:hypothetical protein [Fluviicola sp.]MDF3027010.1 putative lipoprotein precursor [Fluviicola sp.]
MKKTIIFCSVIVFVGLLFTMYYTATFSKFNKSDWNHKQFNGTYDRRDDMLEDLLKNYHLKGMSVPQLRSLFGSRDAELFMINDTLKMEMIISRGNGWKPLTKSLVLYLDKDSIVTSWKIRKYRKKDLKEFKQLILRYKSTRQVQ